MVLPRRTGSAALAREKEVNRESCPKVRAKVEGQLSSLRDRIVLGCL
jgi:hypothetical protein